MKPNPFRTALKILGAGLLGVGAILWLVGLAASSSDGSGFAVVAQGFGATLIAIGWLPFIAWLVVGALQHVPEPADEQLKSEAEIAAWVKEQRAAREKG